MLGVGGIEFERWREIILRGASLGLLEGSAGEEYGWSGSLDFSSNGSSFFIPIRTPPPITRHGMGTKFFRASSFATVALVAASLCAASD